MSPKDSAEPGGRGPVGWQVGPWLVDALRNEIRREGGRAVRLEPRTIELLVYLAERAGQVVGRDEIFAAVWPGVVVGDEALSQAVNKLRKALGDDARSPSFIETTPVRAIRAAARPARVRYGCPLSSRVSVFKVEARHGQEVSCSRMTAWVCPTRRREPAGSCES